MRVRELWEGLGATFEGDGEKELTAAAPLGSAGAADVAFVDTRKAAAAAESSSEGCLIVPVEWSSPSYRTVIRAAQPRTAFARVPLAPLRRVGRFCGQAPPNLAGR